MRITGTYQTLGELNYFIPNPLPPQDPPLDLNGEILSLYGEASFALGKLNEMALRLPDPERFMKAYVIKEALLSSSIEGIHTTLVDVYTHTFSDSKPNKDTQLVLNYSNALESALAMMQKEGLPLINRVILRAHKALLSAGDSDKSSPGQFRKQSVKVGNLIPPPAPEIAKLMGDLEKYINNPSDTPPLIRAGLSHVQFETIHPFLDGNGRIGRLLIVLMLVDSGLLGLPVLYPSYYFKKYHFEYYQYLDRVRTHGDYEGWIVYYLKAIRDSSLDAYERAKKIEDLERSCKTIIHEEQRFARMVENAETVLDYFFTHPISGLAEMVEKLGKSYNTVQKVVQIFLDHHILMEATNQKRNKIYSFTPYLKILENELD